jgi:hypothetical protein
MAERAEVAWIPTRGIAPSVSQILAISLPIILIPLAGFALVGGWSDFARAFELDYSGVEGVAVGVVYGCTVVVPAVVLLMILRHAPTGIGVGAGGVLVASRLGTREIPWDWFQLGRVRPANNWVSFGYGAPGKRGPRGFFWATRDQARAILSYPSSPHQRLSGEFDDWLGPRHG